MYNDMSSKYLDFAGKNGLAMWKESFKTVNVRLFEF